jgi:hypothetical protein
MIPTLLASGIILYGIIQIIVAILAVFLAVKWNKSEFLPGLCFLLLYAVIELIDLFFFTFVNRPFIDVAQFGFILLAIIFFIIGMHPSWAPMMPFYKGEQNRRDDDIPPKKSLLSIVKKI